MNDRLGGVRREPGFREGKYIKAFVIYEVLEASRLVKAVCDRRNRSSIVVSDIESVLNSWRSGRSRIEFNVARKNKEDECEKSETIRLVILKSAR